MNRQVQWSNMDVNFPLIVMNDEYHFVVFRLPESNTFVLPNKDTWTHVVAPKWNPSQVTQLCLYIGSQPQTVYYVHRSNPLRISTENVRSKRLHGKLTDVLYEDQEIIHAMHETFDIKNGDLHHKTLNHSLQEGFDKGCPVVATKNYPGRFAVYLTVPTGRFPGKYRIPTGDDFWGMHQDRGYHPTIVRMRIPFSDGTTRIINLVNVDGVEETEEVRQQLFDTSECTTECDTDTWTQQVIYEMKRNHVHNYKYE